jgi:hypothetical protein
MAGDERRMTYRVVGSRGEATAANFVAPHMDDRVIVTTASGKRIERLGKRSTYTYQLEAVSAYLRNGVPLPIDMDDAVDTIQLIDDCYRAAGVRAPPANHLGLTGERRCTTRLDPLSQVSLHSKNDVAREGKDWSGHPSGSHRRCTFSNHAGDRNFPSVLTRRAAWLDC